MTPSAVPSPVPLATQLTQLGRQRHEYASSRSQATAFLIFGVALLLIAIGSAIYTGIGVFGPGQSGLADSGNLVTLIFVAVVVLFCIAFGGFCVYIGLLPRTSVTQYENGLAIYRNNRLVGIVPWESVTEFYRDVTQYRAYGVATSTLYSYRVKLNDGRSYSFGNNVRRVDQLGERIQEAVIPMIVARAQAAFNAGQPVQFGALTISQAGLAYKDNMMSWAELSGVRVQNGQIELQKQGRWFNWANLRVADTPNALALVALLNQLLANKAR